MTTTTHSHKHWTDKGGHVNVCGEMVSLALWEGKLPKRSTLRPNSVPPVRG
jgi:hypothetical protein